MKTKLLQIILFGFISGLAGYYFGISKVSYDWKNYKPVVNVINREPPPGLSTVDFSLFWTVWERVRASYYDKKALDDPQKLLNGAISGMVSGVGDPYTVYLPPVQNNNFKQSMAGQFEGIGAELGVKGKDIVVVSPLDGSPAQKAGIRTGDIILKVNNESVSGSNLALAVEKIRGPKGTSLTLNIFHKSTSKAEEVEITRDTITVKSVSMWIKPVKDIDGIKLDKKYDNSKVIYFRLSQFGDNTNEEWLSLTNKLALALKGDKNIKGIMLDLRNNPGGYLTDAAFISGEFLKNGSVVVKQDKGGGEIKEFSVSRQGLFLDIPLVVLINKGSASASEIVSGAIRDYGRGKLVGETSFGKGTIQEAQDLGNGAGLHVTIAKWLTPKEIWVHGKGLKPDVEVSLDPKDPSHDTQLEKAVEELVK